MGYTGFVALTENRSMSGKKLKDTERDLNVLDHDGFSRRNLERGKFILLQIP